MPEEGLNPFVAVDGQQGEEFWIYGFFDVWVMNMSWNMEVYHKSKSRLLWYSASSNFKVSSMRRSSIKVEAALLLPR